MGDENPCDCDCDADDLTLALAFAFADDGRCTVSELKCTRVGSTTSPDAMKRLPPPLPPPLPDLPLLLLLLVLV